jgi:hypothetical protein
LKHKPHELCEQCPPLSTSEKHQWTEQNPFAHSKQLVVFTTFAAHGVLLGQQNSAENHKPILKMQKKKKRAAATVDFQSEMMFSAAVFSRC